jgi:hypothetical protein
MAQVAQQLKVKETMVVMPQYELLQVVVVVVQVQ